MPPTRSPTEHQLDQRMVWKNGSESGLWRSSIRRRGGPLQGVAWSTYVGVLHTAAAISSCLGALVFWRQNSLGGLRVAAAVSCRAVELASNEWKLLLTREMWLSTRLVRSQDLSLLCWLQIQHPDFCLDADDFAFWFDMGDEIWAAFETPLCMFRFGLAYFPSGRKTLPGFRKQHERFEISNGHTYNCCKPFGW